MLVDSASRFTPLVKIATKDADHVHRLVRRQPRRIDPAKRHTLPFNNESVLPHRHSNGASDWIDISA